MGNLGGWATQDSRVVGLVADEHPEGEGADPDFLDDAEALMNEMPSPWPVC
jgi:hypothetical protein